MCPFQCTLSWDTAWTSFLPWNCLTCVIMSSWKSSLQPLVTSRPWKCLGCESIVFCICWTFCSVWYHKWKKNLSTFLVCMCCFMRPQICRYHYHYGAFIAKTAHVVFVMFHECLVTLRCARNLCRQTKGGINFLMIQAYNWKKANTLTHNRDI